MKILKHRSNVMAAVHTATNSGTVFYKITLDDLMDMLRSEDSNIWIWKAFHEHGWDAIDMGANLFGSKVVDDTLYICVSDGYDVDIDGELYDPESVLDDIGVESVSEYVQDATKEIVDKYITEYEITEPDFDKWAKDLISDGISFTRMVRDYHEFD